ncbi:hypothetical protein D3C77_437040 [compost metagenome]
MIKARCRQHLGQGMQGIAVKAVDPVGLVGHHQRALAQWVLGGDAGGALVGVAALRLDAANGKHEATRRVHPVGTDGQHAGDIERTDNLAPGTNAHLVAQVQANQGVVHEHQAFAHRHPDVVAELPGRCARTAFLAIDHDKVRHDAGAQHGLGDAHELPGVTQAELEAHRLAARQLTQSGDEPQ